MRAPQYGKVYPPIAKQTPRRAAPPETNHEGPNPEAAKGLRVKPFANIFALVEGLGVISLHRTLNDAQTALEGEIERRRQFNQRLRDVKPASRPQAHEAHDPEADR